MRKSTEWGGGPEIVVLANLLHRPIHVYELHEGHEASEPNALVSAGRPNSGARSSNSTEVPRHASDDGAQTKTTSDTRRHWGREGSRSHAESQGKKCWQLRRIACFGSPRFDRCKGGALHVLSADSRFPDLRIGEQMEQGNHFLALFPVSLPTRQQELDAALSPSKSRRLQGDAKIKTNLRHQGRRADYDAIVAASADESAASCASSSLTSSSTSKGRFLKWRGQQRKDEKIRSGEKDEVAATVASRVHGTKSAGEAEKEKVVVEKRHLGLLKSFVSLIQSLKFLK